MAQPTIYFLGPQGTHSDIALRTFCKRVGWENAILRPLDSIAEIIHTVFHAEDRSVHGCLPLENSIQGSVTYAWDGLIEMVIAQEKLADEIEDTNAETDYPRLVAAWTLPIHHHVLSSPGSDWTLAEKVYSHPQVLAQCRHFIQRELPKAECIPVSSSAQAARMVSEHSLQPQIALGNEIAAELYGLHIAKRAVEDASGNQTRFGLLSKNKAESLFAGAFRPEERTISLCLIGVHNEPGGLWSALTPFHYFGLNLSRIESRPAGRILGEYHFYMDVDFPLGESTEQVQENWRIVCSMLASRGIQLKILGEYLQFGLLENHST
ncbi:prephenate dehydratase [Alicyclobacillus tolerans]|uniref:prephenate dehydratase n=1 Tax=Alicyclobacillus tolerans TaxID=90970 RepID=UPI003B801644